MFSCFCHGCDTNSTEMNQMELQSLQLDVKTLQQNRKVDKQEFLEFRDHVTTNFQSLQKTLGDLQTSLSQFITSLPKPRELPPGTPDVAHGSGQNTTHQGPLKHPVEGLQTPLTVGSAILQDLQTGKELHLDGSSKTPYRHPHFAQNK